MLTLVGVAVAISSAAAWIGFKSASRRTAGRLLDVADGSKARIFAPGGAYRCHVESISKDGITVTSPLQQNHYVPLRVGAAVTIQVPVQDAVMTFRSVVVDRHPEGHWLRLSLPDALRESNRRNERRERMLGDEPAEVNGCPATLLDISEGGARLFVADPVKAGDPVVVCVMADGLEIDAWTLDSVAASREGRRGREIRVRFMTPISRTRIRRLSA